MENPDDLYYSQEHTWVKVTGNRGTIGITDHAQREMGEIIYSDLPEERSQLEKDEIFGTLESSKTVADLYAPVSGEVVSINEDLEEEPSMVNDDPYGRGWLLILEIDDPEELEKLFSASEYEDFLEKKPEKH
ncbi:MAG: glycine cleavage system protein H [Deltaproteobacteria bacterium RBG_19FT_COMBO_52_11]|nr:MAG: glycine cleavage system protein H [Deltaproteobacteria bacterium RBG_19FT_COMBO_52_11]